MSVYFITSRAVGQVKIGFSDEPRGRFLKMRVDSPVELKLERVCDGGREYEAELHRTFADYRLRGEWFSLSPEIEKFMLALPEPATRPKTLTAKFVAMGMGPGYASMIANGHRELNLSMALAFYAAHGERIGGLIDADDHEIEVLLRFIEPWTPVADRTEQSA